MKNKIIYNKYKSIYIYILLLNKNNNFIYELLIRLLSIGIEKKIKDKKPFQIISGSRVRVKQIKKRFF